MQVCRFFEGNPLSYKLVGSLESVSYLTDAQAVVATYLVPNG